MGFVSRHRDRDKHLPEKRYHLLNSAMTDLTSDPDVLAIYLGGSLAKGNYDVYSDIDLHIIVTPARKEDFIKNKRERSREWGKVLFFEDFNPFSPVIVTHYDTFIKVDSWYHTLDEISPSIWLKGLEVMFDPDNILGGIMEISNELVYKPSAEDIDFWRGKFLAFAHETYRAVMREELYYAQSNLDRLRWLIASGWYMEKEQFLDSPYGVWSKIEGKRSGLESWQLSMLDSWNCCKEQGSIMKTTASMIPEFLRLNSSLSKMTNTEEDEEHIRKILEFAY